MMDKASIDTFLTPIRDPQHLRDWVYLYLGIDLPIGHVDPDSNSSPAEWVYDAYNTYRLNRGDQNPGFIILSARECYKTLSESILAILLMVHFGCTVAHLAAIEQQASKAVSYVNSFVTKIKPYVEYYGKKIDSQSKRKISILDDQGNQAYVNVIIATLQGANCISPDTVLHFCDNRTVLAKDVKPGDILKTFDYQLLTDMAVKVGSVSYTEKHCRKVKFSDGSDLILSDDHQIFTQKGWICSSTIKVGDYVTGGAISTRAYNTPDPETLPIKRDLDQMIMGTLLGDASLNCPNGKMVRYSSFHCIKQKSIIDMIKSVFDEHGIESQILQERDGYKIFTKCHSVFEKYHKLFYQDGTKVVTPELLNSLTNEGVAYWLMDDGCAEHEKVGIGKYRNLKLATCCFTQEENQLVSDWFISKGFPSRVGEVSNGKKRYPIVFFDRKSTSDLSDWTRDFFLSDLKYKLIFSQSEFYTRTIDEAEIVSEQNRNGFKYTDDGYCDSPTRRKWRKRLWDHLDKQVIEITPLGKSKLVDIHIDTKNPHHRSFYANSMILLHNSEHTNILTIDEIDVMRFPTAYEEAKLIPGMVEGQFPLTIKTSTRKFAFGLMEKEINAAEKSREKVLRWNIVDVTERCPASRYKPNGDKQIRYIRERQLPLVNISEDEFEILSNEQKVTYRSIEAYEGCADCPLLSVCQMRLAHRNQDDFGGLYKPIQHVINVFSKISPDMAEAQLMCWKPSTRGLVYPKYDDQASTISVAQAYEAFTGQTAPLEVNYSDLIRKMLYAGVKFYGHVDWGYRHNFACVITAQMPNGEWWIVDCFVAPGMELDDMVKLCKEKRDTYRIKRWMADTAYPANIKTFRRNGLPCVKFKKDVDAGIELVRTQVIDASSIRRLRILKTPETEFVRNGFKNHHFKLDAAGNPTREPDDEEFSDVMDAIRYGAQVLYKPGGGMKAAPVEYTPTGTIKVQYQDFITQKVQQLTGGTQGEKMDRSSSGGIYVDFSDPSEIKLDDT